MKDIGFRDREKQEFIEYWKNEFEAEKLYTIAFRYNQAINSIIPLSFEKPVNQINRVLLGGSGITMMSQGAILL